MDRVLESPWPSLIHPSVASEYRSRPQQSRPDAAENKPAHRGRWFLQPRGSPLLEAPTPRNHGPSRHLPPATPFPLGPPHFEQSRNDALVLTLTTSTRRHPLPGDPNHAWQSTDIVPNSAVTFRVARWAVPLIPEM